MHAGFRLNPRRLWGVALLALLMLLLVHGAVWAAEAAGTQAYSFPYLGPGESHKKMIANAFRFQMQLLAGVQGGDAQVAVNALRMLAAAATLIGFIVLVSFKKNWSLGTIIPWLFLVMVMVFAPLGSKLVFFPITAPDVKMKTVASNSPVDVNVHTGKPCTEIPEGCGLTVQLVGVDVGSRLEVLISEIFKSLQWTGLMQRMRAESNLAGDVSLDGASEWYRQNATWFGRCANTTPFSLLLPNSQNQEVSDPPQIYTFGQLWDDIADNYVGGDYAVPPPIAVLPETKDEAKSNFAWEEPETLSAYARGIGSIYKAFGGSGEVVWEKNTDSLVAQVTVKDAIDYLYNKTDFFKVPFTSFNQAKTEMGVNPGFFFVPMSKIAEAGSKDKVTAPFSRACYMRKQGVSEAYSEASIDNDSSELCVSNYKSGNILSTLSYWTGSSPNVVAIMPQKQLASYLTLNGLVKKGANAEKYPGAWAKIAPLFSELRGMPVGYGDFIAKGRLSGENINNFGQALFSGVSYEIKPRPGYGCVYQGRKLVDSAVSVLSNDPGVGGQADATFAPLVTMLRGGKAIPENLTISSILAVSEDELDERPITKKLAENILVYFNNRLRVGRHQPGARNDDSYRQVVLVTALVEIMQKVGENKLKVKPLGTDAEEDSLSRRINMVTGDRSGESAGLLTSILGSGAFLVGSALAKVMSWFTGPLAFAYIQFLMVMMDLVLFSLIVAIPFLFLFGLLIPSNAAGLISIAFLGTMILSTVPATLHLINGVAGMIYDVLPASSGPNAYTMRDFLVLGMAGVYTSLVGVTMYLMFAIGDPKAFLGRLSGLDGAAKDAAQVGMTATIAAALWAAKGPLGMALGVAGELRNRATKKPETPQKSGDQTGGKAPEEVGKLPEAGKDLDKEGFAYGGEMWTPERIGQQMDTNAAADPNADPNTLQLGASRFERDLKGNIKYLGEFRPDGVPEAASVDVVGDQGVWMNGKVYSSADIIKGMDADGNFQGYRFAAQDGALRVVSAPISASPLAPAPATGAGAGNTPPTSTPGAVPGVTPPTSASGSVPGVAPPTAATAQGPGVVPPTAAQGAGVVPPTAAQGAGVAPPTPASGSVPGVVPPTAAPTSAPSAPSGAASGVVPSRSGTLSAGPQPAVPPSPGLEAMAAALDENVAKFKAVAAEASIKRDKLIAAGFSWDSDGVKELSKVIETNLAAAATGDSLKLREAEGVAMDAQREAERKRFEKVGLGRAALSGLYGGWVAGSGNVLGSIPVVGKAIQEVLNEYSEAPERARAWKAKGGFGASQRAAADAKRMAHFQKEMSSYPAGIQYREMIEGGGFRAQAQLARQAASEAVAASRSQYAALYAAAQSEQKGKTVFSAADLEGIGKMAAASRFASLRNESVQMTTRKLDVTVSDGKGGLKDEKVLLNTNVLTDIATSGAMKSFNKSFEENLITHYGVMEKNFMRGGAWDATRNAMASRKAVAQFSNLDLGADYLVGGHLKVVEGKEKFKGLTGTYNAILDLANQEMVGVSKHIEKNKAALLEQFNASMKGKPLVEGVSLASAQQAFMVKEATKQLSKTNPQLLKLTAVHDLAERAGFSQFYNKSLLAPTKLQADFADTIRVMQKGFKDGVKASFGSSANPLVREKRLYDSNNRFVDVMADPLTQLFSTFSKGLSKYAGMGAEDAVRATQVAMNDFKNQLEKLSPQERSKVIVDLAGDKRELGIFALKAGAMDALTRSFKAGGREFADAFEKMVQDRDIFRVQGDNLVYAAYDPLNPEDDTTNFG